MKKEVNIRIIMLCGIAASMNVILGSLITYTHIPLLFLDAIGTIFIAVNFNMKYALITAVSTNLLLGVIHGPLALPFGLVSITIAVVANLCSRKAFTNKEAIITGILVVAIGSLVSAPIRVLLFGGMSNSITDALVFSLKASGRKLITAAYFGAFADGILDKILSCLFVVQINKLPQLHHFLPNFFNKQDTKKHLFVKE